MNKSRTLIRDLVARIEPLDTKEQLAVEDVLRWIGGGYELFRRARPDVPMKHLVSYFALVDHANSSLLLVHHRKADLWVPTGGHVEPDEDPRVTVQRELAEELGDQAAMNSTVAEHPLFVTVTQTRGLGSHTDVSLWYVVLTHKDVPLEPDQREFAGHKWQTFDEVLHTDIEQLDPELHRFVRKLKASLG